MSVFLSKKYMIPALILTGLIAYAAWQFFKAEQLSYMTVMPEVRDIRKQIYATGTLAGRTEVDVGAQVSGQIKKLYVNKGDFVKKGDLLCEIDPEIRLNELKRAEIEVREAAAQIASQEAQLKLKHSEHIRQQKLAAKDATSVQKAEQAEAEWRIAEAELEVLKTAYEKAEIALDDAKTNLSYTKITAPMDGTVFAVPVEEGQTVNANQTTPTIMKIADLALMTVEAEVSEADVVNIAPGMSCYFTVMGLPEREFNAVLRSVDPAPASAEKDSDSTGSSSAVYYNASLDVPNDDGILRIDMTAEVVITADERLQVKAVPLSALRGSVRNGYAVIYQLPEGSSVPVQVRVKTGLKDEQYIEILDENFDMNIPVIIGDDVATAASKAAGVKGPNRIRI